MQRDFVYAELFLRGRHVPCREVGLAADRRELVVERADQSRRRVGALVQVRHLGVEVVTLFWRSAA